MACFLEELADLSFAFFKKCRIYVFLFWLIILSYVLRFSNVIELNFLTKFQKITSVLEDLGTE